MSGKNRKAPRRRGITSECDEVTLDAICDAAHERVVAVLRGLDILVPDATPRLRKRIANRILTMCDGKDRRVRITQEQARDLIMPHMQCIAKNCPELVFWDPISRSLNMFFGEEDGR